MPGRREELFESAQHPGSRRWAVVEDDGRVAYLYLCKPDSTTPVADCFLYSRASLKPDSLEEDGGAPVVPDNYLVSAAPHLPPSSDAVQLRWSDDGESVAVLFGGVLMGFIAKGSRFGFSRLIAKSGPFGSPLDVELYERTFVQPNKSFERTREG
jgi:hypothetical protein